jgi:ATP synthase F1 complex assembly factor 1
MLTRLSKSSKPKLLINPNTIHKLPMPPFKNPSIRRLFTRNPLPARHTQRRWARVHDVRFHATQGAHVQERIFDRYKDKLSRKAKE